MADEIKKIKVNKISDVEWEIPIGTIPNMKVPGRVFASEKMLDKMQQDKTLTQCANVSTLPGIYKYSICLPDGHQGYGFPIGGVAALDTKIGGISPGGIGYDINCGVRLLTTNLTREEVQKKLPDLVEAIFRNIPSGVGSKGKIRVSIDELKEVLSRGANWAVDKGYGRKADLKHLEEEGHLAGADPNACSDMALKRGMPQLGSLGAGNHFLEIQSVERIFNEDVAKTFGITGKDQVCVMIHTGSRGFGHQVCSDYLREMERTFPELLKKLPDRELVFAPAGSEVADKYIKAMRAAANYAWTNRQMIVHWTREAFEQVFKKKSEEMGLDIMYDVAHNLAKVEKYKIDGKTREVNLHRKGATRAFPPGSEEIPKDYQKTGQPVIIPGSMGTASYVLHGAETGEKTFYSTAHGAGRAMSRHAALKQFRGEKVKASLAEKGIIVRSASWKGVAEEAPECYKDIDEVVKVSDKAGIGHLVTRLRPMGVVKG